MSMRYKCMLVFNVKMYKILVLVFLSILNSDVEALKCYACSAAHDTLDQRCINDPASVPGNNIVKCDTYCTSTRVELKDPKDQIQSMNRGCSNKPKHVNEVVEDSTFRTYFLVCQADLCNKGSGKSFSNIGGMIGDAGDEIVLLVPGIGRKSSASTLSSFSVLLLLSVSQYIIT